MTERRSKPYPATKLAANAAVFASVILLGAPAVASSISDKSCPKKEQATLSVPVTQLSAIKVSHDVTLVPTANTASPSSVDTISKTSLLAPRAEAAIREAFGESKLPAATTADVELIKNVLRAPMAGTESVPDATISTDASDEPQPQMKTQLPGVTDSELSDFKKQMFRRDI